MAGTNSCGLRSYHWLLCILHLILMGFTIASRSGYLSTYYFSKHLHDHSRWKQYQEWHIKQSKFTFPWDTSLKITTCSKVCRDVFIGFLLLCYFSLQLPSDSENLFFFTLAFDALIVIHSFFLAFDVIHLLFFCI